MANIPLKTIKFPGLANTYTIPEVSTDLTASGKAADAAETGRQIGLLKADLEDLDERLDSLGDGVPTEVRQAILTLFQSAAYAETGLTDEIAVIGSWAAVVTAISLNQSSISISGANTSQLVSTTTPAGGTVTWASSDTSVATVSSSGLVTGVGNGSCTITASCGGKTATCSVTVSGFAFLTGITATYTQSGTVYNTDSLNSLKSDLVVTANYSDSTTETLSDSDYTLSGTLTEGTSTITVTYGGKTTTFNVTVSEKPWVFESGKTISYTSGVIESNADRTASSPMPINDPTVEHTVTCTVDGTAVNFALRIYGENGLHNTTQFATTNNIGINAYKAFAIAIQQAVTSTSQIVVTLDNESYVGTFGTVTQFTNTVYTNVQIGGINSSTGDVVENQARAVTDFINIAPNGTDTVQYKFTAPNGYYIKVFEYTDTGFIADSSIGNLSSNTISGSRLPYTCTRFRVVFKKSDNSNFTSADLQALTLNNQGIVNYVFTEVNP